MKFESTLACIVVVALCACGPPGGKTASNNGPSNNGNPSNNANPANNGGTLVVDCNAETYVPVEPVPIAIAANDDHVFVASSGAVANPEVVQIISLGAMPSVIATIPQEVRVADLAADSSTLYVLTSSALRLYDLASPEDPTLVGQIAFEDQASSLAAGSGRVFVNFTGFVLPVDISAPASPAAGEPIYYDSIGIGIGINDVAVLDGTLWVVGIEGTLVAIDPASASTLSTTPISPPPPDTYASRGILQYGDHLAVRAGSNLSIFRMNGPSSVGYTASSEIGSARGRISELVRHRDHALVDTTIYDMSDPTAPTWAGRFSTQGYTAWSVGANDDYIFIGYQRNQGEAAGIVEITSVECAQGLE